MTSTELTDIGSQQKDKICPISKTPCPRECIYSHVLESISVGIILLDVARESVIYQNKYSVELLEGSVSRNDYGGISGLLLPDAACWPSGPSDYVPKTLMLGGRLLGYTVYSIEDGYLLVLIRDITDVRKIEEERALHAAALESATDAIAITDTDGVMRYVNGAFERMTGYAREEAVGRTIRLLESGRQDEDFYRQMWATLQRGDVWSGRMVNRKKDGSLYTEDCAISPLRDASARIVFYVARKRDITEKLRLEAIAAAVSTMNTYGYVFSEIRHEIGNPINSLKMILTLLKKGIDRYSREEVMGYYDHALEAIGRSEQVLKSMKKFYMFESPELRNIDAADFFSEFLPQLSEDCAARGIALTVDIQRGLGSLFIDPKALRQALTNVVANSMDALTGDARPQSPAVNIAVAGNASLVHLRVADNGRGMSEEEQAKLFTPFYTSKESGTGLGLVIAKKMLAKMNGTIEIISSPGQGTTVDIVVPAGGTR